MQTLPSSGQALPTRLAILSNCAGQGNMAIVMVLEMTNQFQLAVPVMLACGIAYAVSTQFGAGCTDSPRS